MKKILILSCSTGQGHNSCSQAIIEYLRSQGISADGHETLDFISPSMTRLICSGHSFIYRHMPGLFRWGYRYSENHPAVYSDTSAVYKLLTRGAENMHRFISEGGYDVVITTHVFSALILTNMLKKYPLPVTTAFVATDYTCSPSLEESNLNYYFIPDSTLVDEFAKCGIPKDRIVAAGIPVRIGFMQHTDKADAKRLLGIDPHDRHLLVMCGSMGCGPIPQMLKFISRNLSEGTQVSVICGTNRRLYKRLSHRYRKCERLHIIGYSNQIPLYMDSADLYLTKPGGISVTEAAVKDLPMVFINAVAGCEQYNMDFFVEKGAAVAGDSPKNLALLSMDILSSHCDRIRMEKAMSKYQQAGSAQQIFRELNLGECA